MTEFNRQTIGDLFSLVNGFAFPSREFISTGVPVIKIKNVKAGEMRFDDLSYVNRRFLSERAEKVAQRGDLLITMSGNRLDGTPETWVGKVAEFNRSEPYLVNQRVGILRAHSHIRLISRYFGYALSSPEYQQLFISIATSSGGQANLSPRQILSAPVDVPALCIQEGIAEIIGSLDDKIEQNRRTGRALEALARATFKAWFVDFEPVKAKAAGQSSFPGMPPATFAALPDRFVDSELGPVPEGWEVGKLGDALTLSKQQMNPQDHAGELFAHYSIPAFDSGQNAVVEPGSGIKSQKFVVVPGCVLLSKLNPRIARVWLPPAANGQRQIASTEFLVAVPQPDWTREFLFCLFLQDEFRDSLVQSASGTSNSHQRVRPGDLLTRSLVVPSTSMRDAFTDQVVPQFELRAALHTESGKLAALRDYLLPRLLSGHVRVSPDSSQTSHFQREIV